MTMLKMVKVVIAILALPVSVPQLAQPAYAAVSVRIENCDVGRARQLLGAYYEASVQAKRAAAWVRAQRRDPPIRPLVRKWFGNVDSNQLAYIATTYDNIASAIDREPTKQACVSEQNPECLAGANAYVWREGEFNVHYCTDSFFKLNAGQQWSIVIHEMSHRNSVRGTDDACYGITSWKGKPTCTGLAMTNPERAIRAADPYAQMALAFAIATGSR